MYLGELAVDAQIIKYRMNPDQHNTTSPVEKLWQLFLESEHVVTYEMATSIKCCLETCNTEDMDMITRKIFRCRTVEINGRPVILQWFDCQANASTKPLMYYAALLLAKDGFSASALVGHVDELCVVDVDERFNNIIRDLLELESMDGTTLDRILVPLIQNAHRSLLRTNAMVRCRATMSSVLKLEEARLSSNIGALSSNSWTVNHFSCYSVAAHSACKSTFQNISLQSSTLSVKYRIISKNNT